MPVKYEKSLVCLHSSELWHVVMRPGKRRALDKRTALGQLIDKIETAKARTRAKHRLLSCLSNLD
jgi:hypothetical protein